MTLLDPRDELKATCAHEISHTIGYSVGGLDAKKVKIVSASSGWAQADVPKSLTEEQFNGLLVGVLAGHEGESQYLRIYHGYPIETARRSTRTGAAGDLKKFEYYQQFASRDVTEDEIREIAAGAVLDNWRYLIVAASRLAQARSMNRRDLHAARADEDTADLYMML